MTTLNPSLAAAISAAMSANPTKVNYSGTIGTLMGNSRRLRCLRDANANATDPATTGTEFLNMASTGPLTITAGNITGFGTLSGITKRLAANLGTGSSVLVLEGNGYAITYTLGLPGSGKDFILPSSPTGSPNEGYAFSPGAGTKAPVLLDSGTGPLSVVPTTNAPYTVDLQDWTSGSSAPAGTLTFDARMLNMVFDDADYSSAMGDVRVYYASAPITWGGHQWGALLWVITPGRNYSSTTEPVYQVLVFRWPTSSNWTGYPALSGYVQATSDTFCPAHKAVIKTQAGAALYTFEMRDGLPVSSDQLFDNDILNHAIRPHMNCAQVLGWSSARTKEHPRRPYWFNGFKADVIRPTATRGTAATNQTIPLITFSDSPNSLGHWYAMPKWPFPANVTAYQSDAPNLDPKLFDFTANSLPVPYTSVQTGVFRMTGWGDEPAAQGPMDRFTGPGGSRNDRYGIPNTIAIYYTDPNYVRPRGGEAIRDMFEAWTRHYFNMSYHYMVDQRGGTISLDEAARGIWSYGKGIYYNSGNTFVSGGAAKTVPMFSIPASPTYDGAKPHGGAQVDKNNRMPWNGDSFDDLHGYSCVAQVALYECSPLHAYLAKHRLIAHFLSQIGGDGSEDPTDGGGGLGNSFLQRRHGWRTLQLVRAWKITGDHELMINRKIVEDRLQRELEAVHDYAYKKTLVDNLNTPYYNALRNLGTPSHRTTDGAAWELPTGGQTYYMNTALIEMKTLGLWEVIRAKSVKCSLALDFIIRCMDLASVDFILDTNGRIEAYGPLIYKSAMSTNPTVCDSWADFAVVNPPIGSEDWITSSNGIKYGKPGAAPKPAGPSYDIREHGIEQHNRYQYICMRQDFLSEVPCARTNGLALARAKYKAFYDAVTADVAAGGPDWSSRWTPMGEYNLPPA